jgi:putative MATE family efflux protein
METLDMESISESSKQRLGVWALIREAVHGSQRDFTQGSISQSIFLLSVPMVLEMLMESVFAVVDVFFVGKLGADAVATVGLTESMMVIVYTVAIGLSIGVTAMVARRIGEKNPEAAARVAVQALVIGAAISLIIGTVGVLFAPKLLALMGASKSVIATGSNFTRVMLGGNAVVVFLFLINAVFRGAGDAAIAMRVLWLANAVNIVLDPCLIFGIGPFPELGVTGAAVATTIGRGTGALFAFSNLFREGSRIRVLARHFKVEADLILSLLRLSASGTLQFLVATASWVGLVRIISTFGSEALAGYTIGIRVIIFALLPSWGMSNAAATMVGQSLGAQKPDRAEKAVWLTGFYNMCFLGSVGLFFVIFPGWIVQWFTNEPTVSGYAVACLRTVAFGFLFYAYGMVLTQSFNGAGDTRTPTVINLFTFWLWEIPLGYALAKPLGLGPHGVFWAMMVAFSTLAIVSAIVFKQGRWKESVV